MCPLSDLNTVYSIRGCDKRTKYCSFILDFYGKVGQWDVTCWCTLVYVLWVICTLCTPTYIVYSVQTSHRTYSYEYALVKPHRPTFPYKPCIKLWFPVRYPHPRTLHTVYRSLKGRILMCPNLLHSNDKLAIEALHKTIIFPTLFTPTYIVCSVQITQRTYTYVHQHVTSQWQTLP